MNSRERFEAWIATKFEDWFGYQRDEIALVFARNQDGYKDEEVHIAWLAWQEQERYYNVNNEVTDG